jgi:chromosome segregation ATPase
MNTSEKHNQKNQINVEKEYESLMNELNHLTNQNKRLKIEIDKLRLEKQSLYIKVEDSSGFIKRRIFRVTLSIYFSGSGVFTTVFLSV